MILEQGRPDNWADRLPKEIRVYDLLDRLALSYQRIDHEAAMTMEACAAVDEALEATICKNLMLCNRQNTEFYLLLIPGDKPFKTKELSHQIGTSRLSFAAPEYMEQFLDITYCTEEDAKELLKDEKADGILYASDTVTLTLLAENGSDNMNGSILNSFVEQYHLQSIHGKGR